MMKKNLTLLFISLGLIACANSTNIIKNNENSAKEHNQTVKSLKVLVIDLDKELKEIQERSTKGLRDTVIDTLIFIEKQHKKISFNGEILQKNAPITVSLIPDDNQDNDEVKFKLNRQYTINTLDLKDGDRIIMRDKNGKIFADKVVRRVE